MDVLTKLKKKRIEARIAHDTRKVAFTSFAISEIERVGKNAGNRVTTEDEAISVLKKLLSTAQENLKVTGDTAKLLIEIELLESILPKMVHDDEVKIFLNSLGSSNKGIALKAVREKFGALVDMKRASEIHVEMFS